MRYKTGLIPMSKPLKLRLETYLVSALLPPIPATFGHKGFYAPRSWGMLRNDRLGCCAVAGAMHATMLWRAEAKQRVRFTNLDAQEDYFAITGGQDTGVSLEDQGRYWQNTGFRDSRGNRHKIMAYMQVDETNLDHVDAACYLFGAVGLGVAVEQEEENDFIQGRVWDNSDPAPDPNHYVPMVYKDQDTRTVITWGGEQQITEAWFKAKVSEVVAVVTDENLIAGKSLEGFDTDALMEDLETLSS